MSAPSVPTIVPGRRALLATTGAGRLGTYRTTGALALAPVFPLALTEPSLATTRDTGTPPTPRPAPDRSGLWLRNAAAGLCVLAAAAAAVSFTAQYRMAETARHLPAIAALEAAIPDAAALVFACLGIALALHGRRALRARTLNLTSVAASVFMNAIAAEPGWRNLAIWALPPVAYALASDTLIGVVRAWTLARRHHLDTALAADAATPLAILGGLLLWLLRLALAPPPPSPGSAPGCSTSARSPLAAAPGSFGRPPHRTRGRRPRPPGSWIWSPNGMGLSPRSRCTASPGSAPTWHPSST
jgi:hypothetical protein